MCLGEQAGLVGFVLLVEDLEAGHGDDGGVDAGGFELFGSFEDDGDLGAGGDEDDVLAGGVERVGAAASRLRGPCTSRCRGREGPGGREP